MLRELMADNKHMAAAMRKAHKLADDHGDSGTAGLLDSSFMGSLFGILTITGAPSASAAMISTTRI
jgi:hypothetical protein